MRAEGVKVTTTAPSASVSIKPAQAPGTAMAAAPPAFCSSWKNACRHGREGEAMSLACLSSLWCLPVRSFRSSSFLPASTPLPPPPPPGTCRGGGRGPEGVEKGKHRSRQERATATAHRSRSPLSRSARVKAARAPWHYGTRDICGGGTAGVQRGPAWAGPQKKGTWRKRRSEYVHTHPSSPTQSNPGRASFLPFHIHIPCRTGTGSGTGTTLDRE